MSRARITVTVSPDSLSAAEHDVASGRTSSISAWVDDAMAEKARRDELVDLLEEMRREHGPVTASDDAWARRALGL